MICQYCKFQNHTDCVNHGKEFSACDCQHYERGVILQAKDCHHINVMDDWCPTCGSALDDSDDPERDMETQSGKYVDMKPEPVGEDAIGNSHEKARSRKPDHRQLKKLKK